jgi:hypothetical protein
VTHDRFERWAVEELCKFAFMTVCQCVVVAAEETQVFEHAFASVGPGDGVVNITPSWFATTAFPYTVTISGNDCPTNCGGDDPGTTSNVENL